MPALLLPTPTLAQRIDWDAVIFWVVVLVALAIIGAVALVLMRKSLLSDDGPAARVAFGPRELEAMRDRGELTEEEYQRARTRMVARLTGDEDTPSDDVPVELVPDAEDGPDPAQPAAEEDEDEPDNRQA